MSQVILTESAAADLQRLYRFLAENNPTAARNAVQTIKEALNSLADYPASGRFFAEDYREWPIPFGNHGYLVLYRIEADLVVIVAIRHQRENVYRGWGS